MMGFTAVTFFLASLLFGLLILSLWIRIALRYLRVSYLNPFSQLIYSITNPLVTPIQRLFRYQYKPGAQYDWVSFIVLICVELIKIICLSFIIFHTILPIPFIIIYLIADLIVQPCNLLFYAILIRVIMSYVNPNWHHPLADFLRLLTDPLLRLGRKVIPDISGFDFSPLVVMVILKIITLFISASLPWHLI